MASKHIIFALAALAAGSAAQAQVGAAVTLDAGTTGAGLHLVVPMESTLNGRFGANYFKHDFDKRSGNVDYTADAKLRSFDVLFDWYVLSNSSFHLTGGLVYNGNKVTAQGKPNAGGSFTLNGNTYTAAQVGTLNGEITFRRAAPYLGIGWGNALTPNKRLNFLADVGAVYQGKARVKLVSLGCTFSNTVCGNVARDVAIERADLQKNADDFKVYPVLRARVSYSF
ncbi:hypothetical protein [uncultured Massilia sp.]|uniref:hypothetical protein n=1 Tax=uncultured Massilia sp. TaxID=169973 RepID=UPI0025900737|nr:hypothetical protein [uncultured Massilia sp.]